ncbi:O-antigen ligase family protein [Pseudokordiimonas caeni]|uniref:O-antigen ligase family protein n=1 Tax=Pseudokordiimonas caeni TaxID=2997908 RepID=UPI002811D940|nr:O-antigen ligase family protein [Pseudokordiimonas caeni]
MHKFLIYFLIAFSPLPFASARPAWQLLWTGLILFASIAFFAERIWRKRWLFPGTHLRSIPKVPLVSFGVVTLWAFIQPLSLGIASGQYPFDSTFAFAEVAGAPTSIAVNTEAGFFGALQLLSHLVLFVLVFAYARSPETANRLIRFIAITTTCYAAYGFITYISGNEKILWFDKWASLDSLTSTFVNRNNYATYAGIGIICCLVWCSDIVMPEKTTALNRRERLGQTINLILGRGWVLGLMLLVSFSALMLTNSRLGTAASILAILLFLTTAFVRHCHPGFRKLAVFGTALLALLYVGYNLSGDMLQERLLADPLEDARFEIYPGVIDAIGQRPLTGYGLGSFADIFQMVRSPELPDRVNFDQAHSDYLEMAFSLGIPASLIALIGFISCLIAPLRTLTASDRLFHTKLGILAASFLVAVHSTLDFPLRIPAISYVLTCLLALGVSSGTFAPSISGKHQRTSGR